MVGKMKGRVVRYLENGFAIEFIKQHGARLITFRQPLKDRSTSTTPLTAFNAPLIWGVMMKLLAQFHIHLTPSDSVMSVNSTGCFALALKSLGDGLYRVRHHARKSEPPAPPQRPPCPGLPRLAAAA